MAVSRSAAGSGPACGGAIATLVRTSGSAAHLHVAGLTARTTLSRDLADAVHAVCVLHGHHPGVLDLALAGSDDAPVRGWLEHAAASFARHRAWLVRLSACAGPLPSTPRQAEAEAVAAAQRHAFEMLARSDRTGCALGASLALVLDWRAIGGILAHAAERFGLDGDALPPLPDEASIEDLLDALAPGPSAERAMLFGAEQVLAQHRGLWSLLEARAQARGEH